MKRNKNSFSNQNKFGFTLVELIVVITILVILGTIAFMSLSGFSGSARDSSRVSDIANLSKSLDIRYIKINTYPSPDNSFRVTYTGGTMWTQGTIGDTVMNILGANGTRMNKKPTDPLNIAQEYGYSKLTYRDAYELKTIWEGDSIAYIKSPSFIDQAKAVTGNPTTYIKGNYNGVVAKTETGGMVHVLAIPSLFVNAGTGTIALSSDTATGFYLHGQTSSGGVAFSPSLVYSANTLPSNIAGQTLLATEIARAYSGTILSVNTKVQSFITALTANNTGSLASLGEFSVVNWLGGKVGISCAATPSFVNLGTLSSGSPTIEGQAWSYSVTLGNCTYTCSGGFSGDICLLAPITYTTGNDAYINRTFSTTALVGSTPITWDATSHWWKRTSDSAVLAPNKTAGGTFNTTTIEGTIQTIAYVGNATAESAYNKDQTNNLFVSPAVLSPFTYCRLLNTGYAGSCDTSDTNSITIINGFQGTDPSSSNYHAGYIAHPSILSYTGGGINTGNEQFITSSSKTSTGYIQYISRQSYNSNTSYCEQTYGTGWRLPTDYEAGHRNDTQGTTLGNGWNPAYAGSSGSNFWTSSRSTNVNFRWVIQLWGFSWSDNFVIGSNLRVRCVFFPR